VVRFRIRSFISLLKTHQALSNTYRSLPPSKEFLTQLLI
jgi:hypothetical protein